MLKTVRSPEFAFGAATALCAVLALSSYLRFDQRPMVALGEIFAMLALLPPLFYFQTTKERGMAKRIAGTASCILWVLGIGLAFVIPPASRFIYVPDALLMLGFFPLLYLWKYSWPWLVFGALNIGIGFLLMVIDYSPDNLFPKDLLAPKHHLGQYHPAIVWYTTGLLAALFGTGRLIKNIYFMIRKARSAA
jgi:hypothetical protein